MLHNVLVEPSGWMVKRKSDTGFSIPKAAALLEEPDKGEMNTS